MPTTTSKYSDSFFFGSQYGLASNYFASQGTGVGMAVAKLLIMDGILPEVLLVLVDLQQVES